MVYQIYTCTVCSACTLESADAACSKLRSQPSSCQGTSKWSCEVLSSLPEDAQEHANLVVAYVSDWDPRVGLRGAKQLKLQAEIPGE